MIITYVYKFNNLYYYYNKVLSYEIINKVESNAIL